MEKTGPASQERYPVYDGPQGGPSGITQNSLGKTR